MLNAEDELALDEFLHEMESREELVGVDRLLYWSVKSAEALGRAEVHRVLDLAEQYRARKTAG
ncbi:MAG: hypothetical protein STHCBS139747_003904 [Sporothrix thermara]